MLVQPTPVDAAIGTDRATPGAVRGAAAMDGEVVTSRDVASRNDPVTRPPTAPVTPGFGGVPGAVARQGESLADWPAIVFRPNATSVNAGFFTWEIGSGEVVCEPATYHLHGLPDDTSATMDTFLSRVPESDLPGVIEAMQQMMRSCDTYQLEYRVLGDDGSLRSMEARGRVLPDQNGHPARMIGVVMDTTAMRTLREAEQRRLREGVERAHRTQEFTAALASAVSVDAVIAAGREGLRAYGADSVVIVAVEDRHLTVVASWGFDQVTLEVLTAAAPGIRTPIEDAMEWRSALYLGSAAALAGDYPHLAGVAAAAPQRSWVVLPVAGTRERVGACLIGFPAPHEFPPEERALLIAASGLLTQSLERASMYEKEHALAAELQHGLLPRGTLAAPGLTIATRYQAATSGMEIGGDFYDVIRLRHGRVALVIGDVQGHNLFAASLMGRLRTAVHAYAREGHGPAEVMSRTNKWLVDLNTDPDISLFATCCFVTLHPATGELAMCRAGHPPPAIVTPEAAPRMLDCDGGLPLGIDGKARYATVKMRVPAGAVLVLTTDGLLETDGDDVDYNVRCLLGVLEHATATGLETLADELLNSPRRPPRHGDDVALLLARLDEHVTARRTKSSQPPHN